MIQQYPTYDLWDLTRATIEGFEVTTDLIRIKLRNLGIIAPTEKYPKGIYLPECHLCYTGVVFSLRQITEYVDETRRTFKPIIRAELDQGFSPVTTDLFLHNVEAPSLKLNMYISWDIIAAKVDIHTPNNIIS